MILRETSSVDGHPILQGLGKILKSFLASLPDDRRMLLERYQVLDVARKVVGVGSVGTRCWVILLMGNDEDDPLFLQIKQAQTSVLEPFRKKSEYQA